MEIVHLFTPNFLFRLGIDLVTILILVRLVYHTIYKKKDFFFTFFLFNLIIFIITHMLQAVEFSVGAAFGLFAVFSLLRYRTENISTKDMTYLFVCIALGLINAISRGTYLEVATLDVFIVGFVFALDGNLLIRNEKVQTINYKGLDMIKPDQQPKLMEELRLLTGLDIHKISIEETNFVTGKIVLKIYFHEKS